MNRRSFFRTLAAATAGFAILPPATTYSRVWKATYRLNPDWVNAPYEVILDHGQMLYRGQWEHFVPGQGDPFERVSIFDLTRRRPA